MMDSMSSRPDDDHSMPDVLAEKHLMAINMNMMMMMGPTSTSTSKPSHWKLYDNPFYSSNNPSQSSMKHKHLVRKYSASFKHFHRHTPLDVEVEMEVDQARTQIAELKTELELERKLRKKAEKKVMEQEIKMRDEVCRLKAEIETMKKEMEQERNMLRLAEVFREERLQMKLADAHNLYHQSQHHEHHQSGLSNITNLIKSSTPSTSTDTPSNSTVKSVQRRASPEPENPHIKRGIKGFVEFPRAFKPRKQLPGITTNYHHKVECQKAQLDILLKTKSPLTSHSHPLLRA